MGNIQLAPYLPGIEAKAGADAAATLRGRHERDEQRKIQQQAQANAEEAARIAKAARDEAERAKNKDKPVVEVTTGLDGTVESTTVGGGTPGEPPAPGEDPTSVPVNPDDPNRTQGTVYTGGDAADSHPTEGVDGSWTPLGSAAPRKKNKKKKTTTEKLLGVNYTGPYISGGKFQKSVPFGSAKPLSVMDAVSRLHDSAYHRFRGSVDHLVAADALYAHVLSKLKVPYSSIVGRLVNRGNQAARLAMGSIGVEQFLSSLQNRVKKKKLNEVIAYLREDPSYGKYERQLGLYRSLVTGNSLCCGAPKGDHKSKKIRPLENRGNMGIRSHATLDVGLTTKKKSAAVEQTEAIPATRGVVLRGIKLRKVRRRRGKVGRRKKKQKRKKKLRKH